MAFDPLFDKLPPKGQRNTPATASVQVTAANLSALDRDEAPPNSPITGKPMVQAKVQGIPCYVDLQSRAVYPIAGG